MALFKKKPAAEETMPAEDVEATEDVGQTGPRDSGGELCPSGYVDLGALYVPAEPGIQLRAQFEADKKTLRRILLVTGNSAIQLSVAAAPRSGGVWDELREQVVASIEQMNGTAELVETRYGTELAAMVPVRLPDGGEAHQPLRIIAIEGPRWMLRADLQGAAASGDAEQRERCESILDRLIVNRGSEPRIRLELLPLTLPTKKQPESNE